MKTIHICAITLLIALIIFFTIVECANDTLVSLPKGVWIGGDIKLYNNDGVNGHVSTLSCETEQVVSLYTLESTGSVLYLNRSYAPQDFRSFTFSNLELSSPLWNSSNIYNAQLYDSSKKSTITCCLRFESSSVSARLIFAGSSCSDILLNGDVKKIASLVNWNMYCAKTSGDIVPQFVYPSTQSLSLEVVVGLVIGLCVFFMVFGIVLALSTVCCIWCGVKTIKEGRKRYREQEAEYFRRKGMDFSNQ